MPKQHVKVNLRISEGVRTKGRRGLIWETWKIGHDKPISLSKLLSSLCLRIAEFWMNIGCGSPEEATAQLHKAARELEHVAWQEEPDDGGQKGI